MEGEERTTQYMPPSDKSSILELVNPQNDVINVINALLGLHIQITKDGNTHSATTTRISKPIFTKEYSMGLLGDLNTFLNYTIQVSKFDTSKINLKMKHYLLALKKELATHGDDNYISNDTWQKILDIHKDFSIINGKKVSGWHKFGIYWDYDKPVEYTMVYYTKDFKEEVDQVIIYEKLLSTFSSIIEASFNKSSTNVQHGIGMFLGVLGEMRTESTVFREKEKEKKGISIFGKKEQEQREWQ
jgi:hypothetical protein